MIQSSDATPGADAQVNDQAGSPTAIQHQHDGTCKPAGQTPDHDPTENMHQMKYATLDPDRREAQQGEHSVVSFGARGA
jgi:hypothetical protein